MKDLQALVNETSKKVSTKNWRRDVQSVGHLIVGSGPGSTSGPVVDLEGEDRSEERVQEPAKRRRVETPSKEPATSIRVVPVRSESRDFLQLPRVLSSLIVVALIRPFSWTNLN